MGIVCAGEVVAGELGNNIVVSLGGSGAGENSA